jgi:hypothetical protein
MAFVAACRAVALLRPASAAATPLLRPTWTTAERFCSRSEYQAFVACLRDISASVQADKNYFSVTDGSLRDKLDSRRAATHDSEVLRVLDNVIWSQYHGPVRAQPSIPPNVLLYSA